MPIASRHGRYIDANAVHHQLIQHEESQNLSHAIRLAKALPEYTVRSHFLVDEEGVAVLVAPFLSKPDIDAVNEVCGRSFRITSDRQSLDLFSDCDAGHLPVFAQAYGVQVYVDDQILDMEFAFASSGSATSLLKLPCFSLRSAFYSAKQGHFSSALAMCGENTRSELIDYSLEAVGQELAKVYCLPPMPKTAVRILHLASDSAPCLENLADIIEHDPSLSAQVMRYACSSLFDYHKSDLTCVRDAVTVVLGAERTIQLAIDAVSARALNVVSGGPLGLSAYERHSLHCAVLSQALSMLAKPDHNIDHRQAYLAGLLHNVGMLVIAKLFPVEFNRMNRLRAENASLSMREIEAQVFGVCESNSILSLGHGALGALLLKLWGLPESLVRVAGWHQKPFFEGKDGEYLAIVQLANSLLVQYDIGDEPHDSDMKDVLRFLGISRQDAISLAEETVERCRDLEGVSDVTNVA